MSKMHSAPVSAPECALTERVAALEKERDELLVALRPFADAYRPTAEANAKFGATEKMLEFLDRNRITPTVTMGDFRCAYETLNGQRPASANAGSPATTSELYDIIRSLPPLPEPNYRKLSKGTLFENCWTADQMRAYAADAVRRAAADAGGQHAAAAAIQYALEDDDGMDFLSYWNEGEFDVIRRNWENVPEAVFIGADQLYRPAAKGAGGQNG
jgi:hypothetical protein